MILKNPQSGLKENIFKKKTHTEPIVISTVIEFCSYLLFIDIY